MAETSRATATGRRYSSHLVILPVSDPSGACLQIYLLTFSKGWSTTEESPQNYREFRKQFQVVPADVLFAAYPKRAGEGEE